MKVQRIDEGDIVILEISGRLSGGPDADDFRQMVATLVEEKKKKLLVDLSGVPWMNSTGLGVLVSATATLRNAGAHVKFLNINERVKSILQVTALLGVFESYFRREDALESFRSVKD